jgi:DNA mismatch repair protein MutL
MNLAVRRINGAIGFGQTAADERCKAKTLIPGLQRLNAQHEWFLENAGLDVADFGGSTVLLRAVPADVEPQNAEDLLVEIADRLLKGSRDALNEHTEWVLHSIACRAAIKAGDKSSPQELMALAEKILSGEVPPFCPHGRPCVLKLTRKELEKQFGRIV